MSDEDEKPPLPPHRNIVAPGQFSQKQQQQQQQQQQSQPPSRGAIFQSGASLNDGAKVIIASSRTTTFTTAATTADPFICTCHLFSSQPPPGVASQSGLPSAPAPLQWSSSESTLQCASVDPALRSARAASGGYSSAGLAKMMIDEEMYRRQQWLLHQRHLQQMKLQRRVSSASDSQLADCLACNCCEWFGKALLCSCQLPSSSDEAPSPSRHQQHQHPRQPHLHYRQHLQPLQQYHHHHLQHRQRGQQQQQHKVPKGAAGLRNGVNGANGDLGNGKPR